MLQQRSFAGERRLGLARKHAGEKEGELLASGREKELRGCNYHCPGKHEAESR